MWGLDISLLTVVTSLILVLQASAQKVGIRSEVGASCLYSTLNWNFGCPTDLLPFDCRCSKDDFVVTALNCVLNNTQDFKEVASGWWYIRDQCHYWGSRTLSMDQLRAVYESKKHELIDPETLDKAIKVVPGPIAVPKRLYEEQLVGVHDTKRHYNAGNHFAWGIFGYWGLIMVGGVATNAIRVICPEVYNVIGASNVTRLRKFFTLPALAGKHHHSPFKITQYVSMFMPTRGQFFIILGLWGINIASIVSYLDLRGVTPLYFLDPSDRNLHYVANRTGIVSIAHIPFIVLFASRNNPFIYLTGWSYDVFMTYHRWCARWMGTHAIIHAVLIYWSSIRENAVMYKWHHVHNWRGGNLAVYMCIFIFIMALRRVRSRIYEIFKFTHVLMFLIFIICMVVHLSDYGWLGWIYTALAFYGIEYTSRIARIIMSGGIQEAQFSLVAEGMYRVHLPGVNRKWDVRAGNYVYIRILDKNMFWQTHPFSIFQGAESQEDNSLDLCIRAQLGSTRLILQKLIASDEKSFYKNVMIEGPYGNENYVADYDSVLLFAGGVGFTSMYSFASYILNKIKPGQYLCLIWIVKDCKSLTAFEPEVIFLARNHECCKFRIFVTRPEELDMGVGGQALMGLQDNGQVGKIEPKVNRSATTLVDEVVDGGEIVAVPLEDTAEKASEVKSAVVDVDAADAAEDDHKFQESDTCHVIGNGVKLNVEYGRPNVSAEVCDFIRSANGSKAICSCGPPLFVDVIRDGIIQSIMDSEARVDYFEDAFSW